MSITKILNHRFSFKKPLPGQFSMQPKKNYHLSPFTLYVDVFCRQFETFNFMILIYKNRLLLSRRFKATGSVKGEQGVNWLAKSGVSAKINLNPLNSW